MDMHPTPPFSLRLEDKGKEATGAAAPPPAGGAVTGLSEGLADGFARAPLSFLLLLRRLPILNGLC